MKFDFFLNSFFGRDQTFNRLNRLKPKLDSVVFKGSVRTSKRTPHFTITKINWLTLFKEIIVVYSENNKNAVTDC
jgi:hypothetical protein